MATQIYIREHTYAHASFLIELHLVSLRVSYENEHILNKRTPNKILCNVLYMNINIVVIYIFQY